jgi:hypothetical protein
VRLRNVVRLPRSYLDRNTNSRRRNGLNKRLVHEFFRYTQLGDVLRVMSPLAFFSPSFRRVYHSNARIECLIADFPSPKDELCIKRLAYCVRGVDTIALIDYFAAFVNFNRLAYRFFLNLRIKLVNECALQRINRVVSPPTGYLLRLQV